MAFDPTNASIITNVVAGDGVTVTHSTVNGVDTFTAEIDQTWLASYLATNVGGSLPLSAADEARLAALEAAVGIGSTPSGGTTTPGTPGTAGTTEIEAYMNDPVGGLTATAQITYSLVGIDGTVVAKEKLKIEHGNTPNSIAWALRSTIKRNERMEKYFSDTEVTDDRCVITWKSANVGSTFTIDVTNTNSVDSLGFNVTDY